MDGGGPAERERRGWMVEVAGKKGTYKHQGMKVKNNKFSGRLQIDTRKEKNPLQHMAKFCISTFKETEALTQSLTTKALGHQCTDQ